MKSSDIIPIQEGYKKRQSHHAHRKPVLVMRLSTERPGSRVAVSSGFPLVGITDKGNTGKDETKMEQPRTVLRKPRHEDHMASERMARSIKR